MVSTEDFKISDNVTLHINGDTFDIRELKNGLCQIETLPLIVEKSKTLGKEEIFMTEHQIEIKEKIDIHKRAIQELEIEYEKESINAKAERAAYARYADYSALIKAGFSEEQAFEMLN